MRSINLVVFFLWLLLCLVEAQAQEPNKIEIAPFAGGYFSYGFQWLRLPPSDTMPTPTRIKPVDEENSGLFGVRGSYDFMPRLAFEGSFGFSPAARKWRVFGLTPFQLFAMWRQGHVFNYSGNLLVHSKKESAWRPFATIGLGAITRTGRGPVAGRGVPPSPRPRMRELVSIDQKPARSFAQPPSQQTDLSLNFGGGVKKYLSPHLGIRFDLRDYLSKFAGQTVSNLEVSAGLVFRF